MYRNLALLIVALFWIALALFIRWIDARKEKVQEGPEGIELYLDWRPENDPGWIDSFINKGG